MDQNLTKNLPKKISKELQTFSAEALESHTKNPSKQRVMQQIDAPAHVLALDAMIQEACDQQSSKALQFIDRHALVNQCLVFALT